MLERSERLSSTSFARARFGNGPGQIQHRRDAYRDLVAVADEFEPARLSFKVVESMKGRGAPRFSLTGLGPASDSSIQSLAQYASPQDIEAVELTPLNLAPGTCLSFPGALKGVRYLVFRDTKGALVGQVIPWKTYRRGGPSYMAVPRADDPWLAAVRRAVADERRRR